MDKLEKALQKARQQRAMQLQNAAAEQGRAVSRPASPTFMDSAMAASPAMSRVVPAAEEVMEKQHIIAHRLRSSEADLFRILRTQVLQVMAQSGFKTLGITSPNYGDGKTMVALNLALSIALDLNQTILLADLDLRKPNITDYLGIQAPLGITDYYLRDVPLPQCLLRPSLDRIVILPAGHPLDNSSEVLGSPKVAALAHELKTRYADRLIIYDMPPILSQDDSIAFLPHVDAVLLVVNDGVTDTDALKQSMNILAGANVIGTVLNKAGNNRPKRLDKLLQSLYRKEDAV